MRKTATTLISLVSLIFLLLIQIYVVYNYYQVKSQNFDITYSNAILSNMRSENFELSVDSLNIKLNETALNYLLQSYGFGDSVFVQEMYVTFHHLLETYDNYSSRIKSYAAKSNLDTVYHSEFRINEIVLIDLDNTSIPVYKNNIVQQADKPKGLFIKSYYKEGDYYGISYDYYVDFSHKTRIIFSEMSSLIFLVVLTISMVTLTFLYTLRTLHRQKKLTEVKDDFINNITHEFKTPLSVMSVAVSTLKHKYKNKEPHNETFQILEKQFRYISNMIDNVIDVSLLDKPAVRGKMKRLDIKVIINEIIDSFLATEVSGKNICIKREFTLPDEYTYRMNAEDLTSLVQNLLSNSVKYCESDPCIQIKVFISQGFTIEIADNGIGMSQDQQSKVFEKFYRIGTGITTKGLGLGLYIVKQIVDKYNGNIRLNSKPIMGTIITITLPV